MRGLVSAPSSCYRRIWVMNIISIDLGTTNIKVSVYDQKLHLIATLSETVQYDRNGNFVEFDSDRYFHSIEDMIRKAAGTGCQCRGCCTDHTDRTGRVPDSPGSGQTAHPSGHLMDGYAFRQRVRPAVWAFSS